MSGSVSFAKTVGKQRRLVGLAAALAIGSFWIGATFGHWEIGLFIAAGVALGLVNGLFTEFSLVRAVDSGAMPSRRQYGLTSLLRLMAVSLVAFAIAVAFWPDGATVLVGLAVFHLISLVLTGIPLLKELRKA